MENAGARLFDPQDVINGAVVLYDSEDGTQKLEGDDAEWFEEVFLVAATGPLRYSEARYPDAQTFIHEQDVTDEFPRFAVIQFDEPFGRTRAAVTADRTAAEAVYEQWVRDQVADMGVPFEKSDVLGCGEVFVEPHRA